MSISVIIPTWNRADLLPETLGSVLGQTRPPDEIIVADDGSTDNTLPMLKESYPTVKVLTLPHLGPGAAKNAGAQAATGSHLTFLDSDDLWVPHKLEIQARTFAEIPGLDLCFAYYEEFSNTSNTPQRTFKGYQAGTLMVRREVFALAGDFNTALSHGEFIEWMDRVQRLGFSQTLLPDVLLRRRTHADNLTRESEGPSPNYARMAKILLDRRRTERSGD